MRTELKGDHQIALREGDRLRESSGAAAVENECRVVQARGRQIRISFERCAGEGIFPEIQEEILEGRDGDDTEFVRFRIHFTADLLGDLGERGGAAIDDMVTRGFFEKIDDRRGRITI